VCDDDTTKKNKSGAGSQPNAGGSIYNKPKNKQLEGVKKTLDYTKMHEDPFSLKGLANDSDLQTLLDEYYPRIEHKDENMVLELGEDPSFPVVPKSVEADADLSNLIKDNDEARRYLLLVREELQKAIDKANRTKELYKKKEEQEQQKREKMESQFIQWRHDIADIMAKKQKEFDDTMAVARKLLQEHE
jgi:hypothetical protein